MVFFFEIVTYIFSGVFMVINILYLKSYVVKILKIS